MLEKSVAGPLALCSLYSTCVQFYTNSTHFRGGKKLLRKKNLYAFCF